MCSRRFLKTLENDEKIHLCAWNPLGCRQLSLFIILLMCFIFFTVVEFVYRLLVSGVHMVFFYFSNLIFIISKIRRFQSFNSNYFFIFKKAWFSDLLLAITSKLDYLHPEMMKIIMRAQEQTDKNKDWLTLQDTKVTGKEQDLCDMQTFKKSQAQNSLSIKRHNCAQIEEQFSVTSPHSGQTQWYKCASNFFMSTEHHLSYLAYPNVR